MINIVNIEAVEDKIHVTVSIQEYCNAKNRHIIICDTGDVIKALAEKKVKIGKCIKSRRLCNTRIKNSLQQLLKQFLGIQTQEHR